MGNSYPDRTNARGVWKLSDITRNKLTQGTFPKGAGRGFNAGDNNSPNVQIDTISIKTTGNATDFGDLSQSPGGSVWSVHGSDTRCIFGGAYPVATIIQYIVPTSQGNSADFGDLSVARGYIGGGSNKTRSVNYGGQTPGKGNVIDFMQIQTLGNATDFGDATQQGRQPAGNCNRRRAFLVGGDDGPAPATGTNRIEFVEISTTGNGIDFGDLHATVVSCPQGVGTSTRALQGGGGPSGGLLTRINSFQYDSLGDATDFGDLTVARRLTGAVSDGQRGVWMGGAGSPADVNTIDFVEIASAGNATDFGDCTQAQQSPQSGGDAHQGLDEFFPRAPELYSPTGRPFPDGGGGIGDLGLFAGGEYNYSNVVDFITISTTGDATDFGNLDGTRSAHAGAGSKIRGFTGGGQPGLSNVITYKDFRSKGNFSDFGDLTGVRDKLGSLNNDTRAVWGGGRTETSSNTNSNVMDYITMASIGNASDFGNLSVARKGIQGASSTTRGVFGGGYTPSFVNTMDYITIANTGDASDFGDLSVARAPIGGTGAASSTRATFACGQKNSNSNVIDYITIANTGNATDFGDMEIVSSYATGVSNSVRGVFAGFNNTGATGADGDFGNCPHISYITIASTGNYTDFGDLSLRRYGISGISNGHGGLS